MSEDLAIHKTRYTAAADIACSFGRESFDLSIDDDTRMMWRDIMIAIRAADMVMDITDDIDKRRQLVSGALGFLAEPEKVVFNSGFPEIDDAILNLSNRVQTFEPGLREHFVHKLGQICTVTEEIRTAKSTKELARLTRLEGQLTARLLTMSAPIETRQHANFPSYVQWIARLGRFGNLADTFLDLPTDYATGISKVQPTLSNRIALFGKTVPDLAHIVKHVNPKSYVNLYNATKFPKKSAKNDTVFRRHMLTE